MTKPNPTAAERALLGTVLGTAYTSSVAGGMAAVMSLEPDAFGDPACRRFREMLDNLGADRAVDVQTVSALDSGISMSWLGDLMDSACQSRAEIVKCQEIIAEAWHRRRCKQASSSESAQDVLVTGAWPDPIDLPERPPMPTLTADMLPRALAPWLIDIARQCSVPLEYVAVPAMVGLGSIVGRNLTVAPDAGSDYSKPPNLWGAIVGSPGSRKSSALSAALAPVYELVKSATQSEENLRVVMATDKIIAENDLARAKRSNSRDEIADALRRIDGATVREKTYITADCTQEKLGMLCVDNPRGVMIVRDELSGWISQFARAGREGEEEFFLAAWNGTTPHSFHRVVRGHTACIPCVSVIGGIQPGRILGLVDTHTDNGFLQRFTMLAWPDRDIALDVRHVTPDRRALRDAMDIYAGIDSACSCMCDSPVRLEESAQLKYESWRLEQDFARRTGVVGGNIEAVAAKHASLIPSLALLFWLSDGHWIPGRIDYDSIVLAIQWSDLLLAHTGRIYGQGGADDATRILAGKIKDHVIDHGQPIKEIYGARWPGLDSTEAVAAAVKALTGLNWVRVATDSNKGRSRCVLHLHPSLRRV